MLVSLNVKCKLCNCRYDSKNSFTRESYITPLLQIILLSWFVKWFLEDKLQNNNRRRCSLAHNISCTTLYFYCTKFLNFLYFFFWNLIFNRSPLIKIFFGWILHFLYCFFFFLKFNFYLFSTNENIFCCTSYRFSQKWQPFKRS